MRSPLQYVLAKMVNHFSSFRSQKALRKTHFFENPFLRIWARVQNSWEKPVFEQYFHKKQRFGKIARKSLVKMNHFLVFSLEAQKKTHFFENPFWGNRPRVEKSREFSKNPFYRKPIFARTYCILDSLWMNKLLQTIHIILSGNRPDYSV